MRRLNLLVLRCRDIDATRAFYERLGLTFTHHSHDGGPEHVAHEDEHGVIELYPVADGAAPDSAGLGFDSPDLEEAAAKLVQAGTQPGAVTDRPWGRTFVVRDPDGRRVEVKQVESEA